MEVKIHTETECPVPNQRHDLKVNLENVECIGDLKKKLQPLLSVAGCDMTVTVDYETQTFPSRKLEDRERLSSLYVQEGDTFIVKFVSVCNMPALNEVLDNMRSFEREVCEPFSREGEGITMDVPKYVGSRLVDWNNVNNLYRSVIRSLEICSYDMFLPWSNKPTNANRHYFVREGGLEMLANILNFASKKRYQSTSEDVESMSNYFNDKQSQMELFCLLCLWNFSEIKEDRLLVLKKIGLEPFIHSLLKVAPDIVENQELNSVHICEGAVGCLAQYVELSDIQQIFAENKEALLKLLWLTSNGTDNYQKEVAANTLFCCSNHPKAAAKIIENHCYRTVLEKAQEFKLVEDAYYPSYSYTPAVAYFFCLLLANIQTLPDQNLLTDEERENIDQVLEGFLRIVNPREIGEFQEEHNYVWITLKPFLQLALSTPSLHFEMENEGLQSHPKVCRSLQSERAKSSKNEQCCIKSCNNHRIPYTFSPAGKLGLFCLCHLTNTQENRELLRKEKLIDYLICVCWFAQRCPEVEKLTPKLDGFGHFEPPRLESIARAYLTKCFSSKIM